MRKVAIFDIDGTIFRSSLLIELTEALIRERIFPKNASNQYIRHYKNWLDRKGTYEKYINAVVDVFNKNIRGVQYSVFLKVAKKTMIFQQDRVYRYPRDFIKKLKKKNYYILAISNSPREIVGVFCKALGFNKVYGRIYEVAKSPPNSSRQYGKFTGRVSYEKLISDKSKILSRALKNNNLTLQRSVGVGDTESDITFLKMVERPICFNPNKKLYSYAKKAGWKIIVERKDVIYDRF